MSTMVSDQASVLSFLFLILLLCLHDSRAFQSVTLRKNRVTTLLWSSTPSSTPLVLCIGDVLFDCIAKDYALGFSVEQMMENNSWTAFPGGAPANVATACCKLGTSSAFIGCIGADEDGDALESLLKEVGVDTRLLQRSKDDSPTRRIMVTRSLKGDREFGGFYQGRLANQFADCQLDSAALFQNGNDDAMRNAARSIMSDAKWIVCSTLSLAFDQSATAIYDIVDRGLESGKSRLYVDINWRPVFWPADGEEAARNAILRFAQRAHIVKLTDEEAEWLLGVPAEEALLDPARVHGEFPDALGVLVTAGENGAAYSMLGSTDILNRFG